MKRTLILFAFASVVALLPQPAMAIRGAHPTKLALGASTSFIPLTAQDAALSALVPLSPDGRLLLQPKLGLDFEKREGKAKDGLLLIGSGLYYDVIEKTNLSIFAGGALALIGQFAEANCFGLDMNGSIGARFRFTDVPDLYFSAETGLGLRAYLNQGAGIRALLGGIVPFRAGFFYQL